MTTPSEQGQPGPGVDRVGNPVIDPTKNVLDLVAAETKRQDDLREMDSTHMREILALRSEFYSELRHAEANRIDAIRAVDVGNVQRAAETQAAQAATIATQVAASAEALRNQVQAAATAAAAALSAALDPIQKDIADLRRAQYEAQGQKTQVVETRATSGAAMALIASGLGVLLFVMALISLYLAVSK